MTDRSSRGRVIDLTGKVALVTGASRGIGFATARAFAECGARVMLSSRKLENLTRAASAIGGDVDVVVANAGEPEQAAAAVAATIRRFGCVDILVNNAATSPYFGLLVDADAPRFDKTMVVNVRGPLAWTQEAWRQSMKRRGGTVINIGSIGASGYTGPLGVYHASKAALEHLTRHLATEVGPTVRVNLIAAGLTKTEFSRAVWQSAADGDSFPWPLRRIGLPEDIANAALFLASVPTRKSC